MSEFFASGHCRHYQLVDGWAKVWCIRTDEGHTEHRTESGQRWVAALTPDGQEGER